MIVDLLVRNNRGRTLTNTGSGFTLSMFLFRTEKKNNLIPLALFLYIPEKRKKVFLIFYEGKKGNTGKKWANWQVSLQDRGNKILRELCLR